MTNANLEVAINIASIGLPILPCTIDKRATLSDWPNKSSIDPARLNEWFAGGDRAPAINLGATNLVVVDLDNHEGGANGVESFKELLKQNESITNNWVIVATPNKGFHIYFLQPSNGERIRNSTGKIAPGVDIRGDGGYILAPNASLGQGKVYRAFNDHPELIEAYKAGTIPELPEWIAALLQRPKLQEEVTGNPPSEKYARAAFESECGRVATASQGRRNDTLNKAAFSLGQFIPNRALTRSEVESGLLRAALAAGLDRDEAEATIASGLNSGALNPRDVRKDKPLGLQERKKVILKCAADIEPEKIEFLMDGYLAHKKFHILAGAPGVGKTTILIALAAMISTGSKLPTGEKAEPGNIVMWTGEDGYEDTIIPKFLASGGDRKRLYVIEGTKTSKFSRQFDPSRDMLVLNDAIAEIKGCRLIIVDPVVSAVRSDSHKNAETRRSLQPLVELASATGAAVIGVTHLTKGTSGRDPVERINGSLAFGALARIVMFATKEKIAKPGSAQRNILIRGKSNIGLDRGGFMFSVVEKAVPDYQHIKAHIVQFEESVDETATEILNPEEGQSETRSALSEAEIFLNEVLSSGNQPASKIKKMAKEAGVAAITLQRAKEKLGCVSIKTSHGWVWGLPQDDHLHESVINDNLDHLEAALITLAKDSSKMINSSQGNQDDHSSSSKELDHLGEPLSKLRRSPINEYGSEDGGVDI